MRLNFRKIILPGFALLVALLIADSGPVSAQDREPHKTGLREPTARDEALIKKRWLKIKKVRPNPIGLQRINKARLKKGLLPLEPEAAAPQGQDVSGSTAATGTDDGSALPAGSLPGYVDNSGLPAFPPIRSQGSLNSCVPFAINYYQMTHNTALARGWDNHNADDTTKFSPKWAYNMINGGENQGTYFTDAYRVLEKHGSALWADFPYDGNYRQWCLDPAVWEDAIGHRTQAVAYITSASSSSGLDQLKSLLNNGYVVIFGTYINSWQYKTIGNDPATIDDDVFAGEPVGYWMNGTAGGHAMTFVGYNDHLWVDINGNGAIDSGERGALRVANSWGSGWKDGGFVWLAYDALRTTSAVSGAPTSGRRGALMSDRTYHLAVRDNYQPRMLAQFTVSHLKRNQLGITLGVSDGTRQTPATVWSAGEITYQGGGFAFDGSTAAVDGTFVFDFSDIVPDYAGQRWYVGMRDSTSGDTASLKDFQLIDVANGGIVGASADVPRFADGGDQAYARVDYDFSDGNLAPDAQFTADPKSGDIPLNVDFDAGASSDNDGTIVRYDWDFGDGTSASGITASHTYNAGGMFSAVLTVTDDGGKNGTARVVITTTDPNTIIAPDSLTATAGNGSVYLSWNDRSDNEQGFEIQRARKIRGKYNYATVGQTGADSTTFNDEPGDTGTYRYRVRAFNNISASDYTDPVSVTLDESAPPSPDALKAPANLTADIDGTAITLVWIDSNGDEKGFYVERGTRISGKVTYGRIDSTPADVTTFSDTPASIGTYYYRVQAYNDDGTSAYSNAARIRLK